MKFRSYFLKIIYNHIFFLIKDIFKSITKIGKKIKFRLISAILSYKWIFISKRKKIFLELGSGPKKGNSGWVTIDLYGSDIIHNLSEGILLPDESVDKIYSSHLLEHIAYNDLIILLNECFRVLKKGGEFLVCVPNAKKYIICYLNDELVKPREFWYKQALIDTGSFIDQVNYVAYMDNQHKYMFDEINLINTLKLLPFKKVFERSFDSKIDDYSRKLDSIYACAIK